MSTSRQASRDRSRRLSSLEPEGLGFPQHKDSISKAGTKRLFSNRFSKTSDIYGDGYENAELEGEVEEPHSVHSGKRRRSDNWPLPNSSPVRSPIAPRSPLRSRNAPNSPNRQRSSPPQRPSKFLEGSMHDRVSQKPPTPYLGETEEDYLERDENTRRDESRGRKLSRARKSTYQNPSAREGSVGRSESRHSSIFRFGKSIAASFNPGNWKIWSKPEQIEENVVTEANLTEERRVKAEKAYQELKAAGKFVDTRNGHQSYQRASVVKEQMTPSHKAQMTPSQKAQQDYNELVEAGLFLDPQNEFKRYHRAASIKEGMTTPAKHDSGVSIGTDNMASIRGSLEMSRDDKRKGRVFLEPPASALRRGESPAAASIAQSNSSSPTKSLFIKKPSFSNMKRPSLANIKKAFASSGSFIEQEDGHQSARRIPSRKDLQKQQKLVKRVSNLEDKLEAAKRELNQSLSDETPIQRPPRIGRPKFVPGALATLPSERLLSGYLPPEDEDDEDNESMAVTAENTKKNALTRAWVDKAGPSFVKKEDYPIPSTENEPMIRPTVNHMAVDRIAEAYEAASKLKNPGPASSDLSDCGESQEEDHFEMEVPAVPEPFRPMPPVSMPKKRKGGASGSVYQPSTVAESEEESEPKPRRKAAPRPRKLQKTTQEHSVSGSPSMTETKSQPKSNNSASRRSGPPTSMTGSMVSRTSSRKTSPKLQKKSITSPPPSGHLMKKESIRGRQQSHSPPPSAEFTGIEHSKPAKPLPRPKRGEAAYVADPAEDDIPPMPPMPKAIRMPSGEIIDPTMKVAKANSLTSRKVIKKRPSSTIGVNYTRDRRGDESAKAQRAKENFEWPEDVF